MMSDRLRHFLGMVSVFLVSIGLMGATPKKSQAADPVLCGVGAAVVGTGGGLVACYFAWLWFDTPTPCTTGANCPAANPLDVAQGCRNRGNSCNGTGDTNCKCRDSIQTGCACGLQAN